MAQDSAEQILVVKDCPSPQIKRGVSILPILRGASLTGLIRRFIVHAVETNPAVVHRKVSGARKGAEARSALSCVVHNTSFPACF
jgi:hypothetical protein